MCLCENENNFKCMLIECCIDDLCILSKKATENKFYKYIRIGLKILSGEKLRWWEVNLIQAYTCQFYLMCHFRLHQKKNYCLKFSKRFR